MRWDISTSSTLSSVVLQCQVVTDTPAGGVHQVSFLILCSSQAWPWLIEALLQHRRPNAEGHHPIQCGSIPSSTRMQRTDCLPGLPLCTVPTALSHFRQNPLQGAFKHSLFQGFSRVVSQVPYFLIPFVVGKCWMCYSGSFGKGIT